MKVFVASTIGLMLLSASDAEAGHLFGSHKDRFDKHCDRQEGLQPGYGSPRCRIEAPLACGERQLVNFFGLRYVHVGSCK
jgi:hypothetical protein